MYINVYMIYICSSSADAQLPSRHSATPPWCDLPSNTPPACEAQLRRKTLTNSRRCSVGQLDWRLPAHKQRNIHATATPVAIPPDPSGKDPSRYAIPDSISAGGHPG